MKTCLKGKDFDVNVCEDIVFLLASLLTLKATVATHAYITSPVEISIHRFSVEIHVHNDRRNWP